MTENGLGIQSKSTKRTDFQTNRILLLVQVTDKREKADPSHLLILLLASRTNGTIGFTRHTSQHFAKAKEPFYDNAPKNFKLNNLSLKVEVI